jgi:hypothetical protein
MFSGTLAVVPEVKAGGVFAGVGVGVDMGAGLLSLPLHAARKIKRPRADPVRIRQSPHIVPYPTRFAGISFRAANELSFWVLHRSMVNGKKPERPMPGARQ